MRLPVNALLYVASCGLLAASGWFFYNATEKLGAPKPSTFSETGRKDGESSVARGKGMGPATANWSYTPQSWWQAFREARLIGKMPPPPVQPGQEAPKPVEPPKPPVKPLEQIIEVISLLYESTSEGKGGDSLAVIRYKPEANVQPPEDVLRKYAASANQLPTGGARPADVVSAPARPGGRAPNAPRGSSAMPISSGSRDYVQYLLPGESLWPPYTDIVLARISSDAESAFFQRKDMPLPQVQPGDPAPKPVEEELIKSSMPLSQEVMKELLEQRRAGRAVSGVREESENAVVDAGQWVDVEETKRIDNVWNIGRNDERSFRENDEGFLEQINLDTYQSRFDGTKGVKVVNIDNQISNRFGIQSGDVLLSVNGEEVRNKSEAISVVKRQYNRGSRTFVARFLSAGQIVERTYQAPPGR
ncbi:MAG: hypothetical protein RL148_1743 [Planctomycetota bacterium]|jgi:hypothetical protein